MAWLAFPVFLCLLCAGCTSIGKNTRGSSDEPYKQTIENRGGANKDKPSRWGRIFGSLKKGESAPKSKREIKRTGDLTNRRGVTFDGWLAGREGSWIHLKSRDGRYFTVSIENFAGQRRKWIEDKAPELHQPPYPVVIYEGDETTSEDGKILNLRTRLPVSGRVLMRSLGGKLMAKLSCHKGKLHGVCSYWDDSGRRMAEVEFADGMQHGISVHWYPEGGLQSRAYYFQGEPDGPMEEYFPRGKRKSQSKWEYGKPVGKREEWHANGHQSRQVTYIAGRVWSIVEWDDSGNLVRMERSLTHAPRITIEKL